ncbi:MAG: hypothetical protein J6P71_06665, partial [Oscillospiraceae bacterium]|nr:hypothetical protein [Oscillospiraceae bacterium]
MKKASFAGSTKEALMAAGEGFEPSQTESESVVLPLHNSASVNKRYYTLIPEKSKRKIKNF